MPRWGSPASGSLAQTRAPAPPAERGGGPLPGRGALAAARLAVATVAGLVGAALALAPLAFRGGPSRSRASAGAAGAAPVPGPRPARVPPAASPPPSL